MASPDHASDCRSDPGNQLSEPRTSGAPISMTRQTPYFHFVVVFALVAIAAGVRLWFFSGFVLGDDPGYADLVRLIIDAGYPRVESHSVLAARPVVLYSIALTVYLFGRIEWAFVLPFFLASLLNTAVVYLAGNRLAGPAAGVIAGSAYLAFPLDAVHATTATNDILLSSFVWGGGLLLLISHDAYDRRVGRLLIALSGFVVGAAVAVKINALVAFALFPVALLWASRKRLPDRGVRAAAVWCGGWFLANLLLSMFLLQVGDDLFAQYRAELNFNLEHNPSGYVAGAANLIRFLRYYPDLIFGWMKEGHPGYEFMPYGFFFVGFLFCVPLVFFERFKAIRLPALLALAYLLIMEFAPLRISPDYVPIHRLPRFLHIASIPAAVTIGVAARIFMESRQLAVKAGVWLAIAALGLTSLHHARLKSAFYQDAARDQRWAWELVRRGSTDRVICDPELGNYLRFRFGFDPPMALQSPERLPLTAPSGSWIFLGGARRPDMDPGYADAWSQGRSTEGWILVGDARFEHRPWRPQNLRLFITP